MKSQQKYKHQRRRDTLVLKLSVLVLLVLAVFEGPLIFTMISHSTASKSTVETVQKDPSVSDTGQTEDETEAKEVPKVTVTAGSSQLAGLSTAVTSTAAAETEAPKKATVSNPDSPAIVRKNTSPVDDSYFSDAAFIGDSRMEGFRNASGITQGTFFTSVGMSTSKMANEAVIATPQGNITVAAALSGGVYNKIYIMLGANDLGEWDWNSFHDRFVSAVKRFKELQPDALIYICSCIYVDESKGTSSYVNNANVDTLNGILLQICEDQGYYYLDLNEFLSDGTGKLLSDASSDGVHLYGQYCEQVLEYLKTHYIEPEEPQTEAPDETETETMEETESSDKE